MQRGRPAPPSFTSLAPAWARPKKTNGTGVLEPELKSAYTKILTYIEKDRFMPRKVEFFGKKGQHVKTMKILKVQEQGGTLVPMHTTMENLKRGTRTEVRVENVQVNLPADKLPDYLFTPESLQSEG